MTATPNAPPESLAGQLLIAAPSMRDPRFAGSLVYVIAHSEEGAMGLVVNKPTSIITFPFLAKQLGIDLGDSSPPGLPPIHFGGPVETKRGFVLHSLDYRCRSTSCFEPGIGLTTTPEIIKDIAAGKGPRRCLLALGYAGWGQGQVEKELQAMGWLHIPAETDLIFGGDEGKWKRAVARLGFDITQLSSSAGHA